MRISVVPKTQVVVTPVNGLLFPSNISGTDTSAPFVAIQFDAPQSNGLPIWGPSGTGVTVIRRYRPLQQTGYYAAFWWSQGDGNFSGSNGYWGFHPYPNNTGTSGVVHWWEIASRAEDYIDVNGTNAPDGGDPHVVNKNVFYKQAIIVTRANANSKTLTFYWNLPNTGSTDKVAVTVTLASYGESDPPTPKVTIGDSPWFASFQHERLSGTLGPIKIIAKALSEADMLLEAADMTQLVTADGIANIWWGKKSFATVDSLTCDYGTGRSFVWATATKATLDTNI